MAKYVIRFMPEYHATSLWACNDDAYSDLGINIEYEKVGLSQELINQLEKFDDGVMDIIDWSDPGGESPLTSEEQMALYNEGCRLLELVRKELGDEFEVENELGWIKPFGS